MVKESLSGKTENDMKVNLKMIEGMVKESLDGLMEESMKEVGNKENSMEKEFLLMQKVKRKEVNGRMVNELGGSLIKHQRI